jgi:hypothetical protein
MLVLKPEKIFEKCLLTKGIKPITQHAETFSNNDLHEINENVSSLEEIVCETEVVHDPNNSIPIESNIVDAPHLEALEEPPIESSEVFSNNIPESFEPVEVEFNLDDLNTDDTIQLQNRNDVYYKMYREAKKKAKMAKDLALSSYLEAKRIKNTYMLEDISDSDLDSDLDESEQ